MRRLTQIALASTVLALDATLIVPSVGAQPVSTPDLSRRLTAFDAAIEKEVRQSGVPGAAIVVVNDENVIYQRAFGSRHALGGLPVTLDTLFPLGSVSKAFTAMALLIAQEKGILSLDDPPKKYLPYFKLRDPSADAHITIRNLLTHSSGLARTDFTWQGGLLSREEVIRVTSHIMPTAKLGEKFQYNNNMYLVAGEVLGRALGTSWEQAITSQLLRPLRMNATVPSSEVLRRTSDSARGHFLFNVPGLGRWPIPAWTANATNIGAAAAITSNARDLAHWLRFLLGRGSLDDVNLVSQQVFDQAFSNQFSLGNVHYGLGWFVSEYKGHKFVTHPGKLIGFESIVILFPEHQLGVALLTNAHDSSLPNTVFEQVLTHLADPRERAPADAGNKK